MDNETAKTMNAIREMSAEVIKQVRSTGVPEIGLLRRIGKAYWRLADNLLSAGVGLDGNPAQSVHELADMLANEGQPTCDDKPSCRKMACDDESLPLAIRERLRNRFGR